MKYLIASSGPDLQAQIAKRFGHAEYFIVLDSETMEYEALPGVGHDEPAHGIGRFRDQNVERVIIGNIGPEAFQDLKQAGWTPYLCRKMTVQEAVEKVERGEVSPLEAPTAKRSIHSARQAEGGDHDHHNGRHEGGGHGMGQGRGRGLGGK